MITIQFFRNMNGSIYGFDVNNHGEEIVCAAVSVLTINTMNSIEYLTEEESTCDVDEENENNEENWGFISYRVPKIASGEESHDVELLLESYRLGIASIEVEYYNELRLIDENNS